MPRYKLTLEYDGTPYVGWQMQENGASVQGRLAEAITKLVSKYHDASAPGGRAHRLVVVAHPLPQKSEPKEPS